MILEIGIGDSYGSPFEFAQKEFVDANNDGLHYAVRTSKHGSVMGGGVYTDDTQMSLAVAETILSEPPTFTPLIFAAGYMTAFKRDVPYRRGYGSRVRLALTNSFSGTEFMSNITELHSSSNGSVMRVLPCGILATPEMVQNAAIAQAVSTHLHYDAIDASRVLALVVHSLIYRDKMKFAAHVAWAMMQCGFRINHPMLNKFKEYDSIPCDAMATVGAAFDVVAKSRTYQDILVRSVNMLGDVDSIAAIAMGLASLMPEINKKLTNNTLFVLFDQLENGQFGRDYCIKLDKQIDKYIEKTKAEMTEKNALLELAKI